MGYLKIYSPLSLPELRQLHLRERYKKINPAWDDSLVLMSQLFQPFTKAGMRVLDAGCGHGNVIIDENRNKIKEVVGIDINPKATEKNVCLDKIVIGDLEKMPFANGEFDVVLSQWVLEHLKSPNQVFAEIYRVLKPGGAFIFVTPYRRNYLLLSRRILKGKMLKKLLGKFYGRKKEDIFPAFYKANTPELLESKLTAVGFKKKTLFLNGDPSYLGVINDWFFSFGVLLEKIAPFNLAKMHILGVFIK